MSGMMAPMRRTSSRIHSAAPELDSLVRGLADGALRGAAEGASAAAAMVSDAEGRSAIATAGTLALPAIDAELGSEAVDLDTVFDLASVTKVVTALTAAVLIDEGLLDLDEPVAARLGPLAPDPRITARHLLTHTSGLPPTMDLQAIPGGRGPRLRAIGTARLLAEPGTAHAYSCIGFIVLGVLLEELGGLSLPRLSRRLVLDPIGAFGATWAPDPQACAATEVQEGQLMRGRVHDETARSLSAPQRTAAGNAGLFADAASATDLARALVADVGRFRLSPAIRRLLRTDQLAPEIPVAGSWRQGLGLRIGHDLDGGAHDPRLVGHPGFTGCSVLADPRTGSAAVLLTNRVHPSRELFTVARARARLAGILRAHGMM